MSESARLRLPFLAAAQAQKHVTHNEALVALDTLVQASVLDRDLAAPPGSPDEGDCYIVAASATGDWTGWDGRIARYEDGAWRSFLPGPGWLVFAQDEGALCVFDGADWVALGGGGGGGEGEANTASNLGSTVGRQGVFASKSGVDLRFKSLVATGGLSLSADSAEVTIDGAAKVGTARTIGTSGLASGGGDLSADRTIAVPVASQAEAEAGTDNTKAMTPLRTAEAIAALAPGGGSGEANTASNLGSTVGRQGVFASKSGVDLRFKSLVATGGLSLSADASEITVDGAAKVGTARTIGTSGLASGGGDLSADRTIAVAEASQAEAEAGSSGTVALTPRRFVQALNVLLGLRIAGATAKTTPVGADELAIADSAASGATKKLTIGNLFGQLLTIASGLIASTAELWTGTSDADVVTPKGLTDAHAIVDVTPSGSTFTPSQNAGTNFRLALGSGANTLALMSNLKNGRGGTIWCVNHAAGSTLTTSAYLRRTSGAALAGFDETAGAVNILGYQTNQAGTGVALWLVGEKFA